jgi:hypothetical protein
MSVLKIEIVRGRVRLISKEVSAWKSPFGFAVMLALGLDIFLILTYPWSVSCLGTMIKCASFDSHVLESSGEDHNPSQ